MSVHTDAARLALQAYADGEGDVLDQLHAGNYVDHCPLPGQGAGPAGLREQAMVFSSAFDDSRVTADVLVDNGDTVVLQARCRGVHTGEFYGVAATGRRVKTVGICVFRFVDGLIAESWSSFGIQGLLTSMTEPRDSADHARERQRSLA